MAFRPRTRTFRAQSPDRRVYDTFQPKSEMKETPEAYLLHVYLPGFPKERLQITYVGSSRIVRIKGERQIQGNRWSRFEQTYPVPENCAAEEFQGKFDLGTLTLTMPKKSISQVAPKPEVKTTQERSPGPSDKAGAEAKPEKVQENTPPQYTTPKLEEPIEDKKSAPLPSPAKGADEAKKATLEDMSSKRPFESRKPEEEKGLEAFIPPEPIRESIPRKGQEEAVKKPRVTGKPPKRQEEVDTKPALTTVSRDPEEEKSQDDIRQKKRLAEIKKQLEGKAEGTRAEDAVKESISKKKVEQEDAKHSESRKPEKDMEKGAFKEKEIRTRKVTHKEEKPSSSKVQEKEKAPSSKEGMRKEDVGNGIKDIAASASQLVSRIAEGKLSDEEKPLVINMGAAALVIAALGAYVSYRFSSS